MDAGREFDLAIIGGGINGCGIARDAAGRGASVYLCEMNDLASGTSSWSTKLIHGGLRYLEYFEFRLVREALIEREVLWRLAPHIVHPLRLVLPHHRGLRPAWLLRLGLFLYDHLGARGLLPPTAVVDLVHSELGQPLKPNTFRRGFEYSDCTVDDARLVIANAQDAERRGAVIAPRTRAVSARVENGAWMLDVEETATGATYQIRALSLVNAAGPWVEEVLRASMGREPGAKVRLVQGSHILVRKLYAHDRAYIFQNTDGRIVFAIPYERDFTLIGTTDRDYTGDPGGAVATDEEVAYLCAAASEYFARPVAIEDVVWKYAGIRPLYDDGASEAKAATRDYVFELEKAGSGPPLLSIFGGKITTYRRLAEAALRKLAPHVDALKSAGAWTAGAQLPGGEFPVEGLAAIEADIGSRYPFLGADRAHRLARTYGTLAGSMLGEAAAPADLGQDFGGGLTQREVDYLVAHEWARSAEDILWRRTKLGLVVDAAGVRALEAYLGEQLARSGASMRSAQV
ncbi:MAG: glycerol-3-phosphate dehydrogenase [Hyphomicrobiales bacterium]|nr:MAG: glycerol-3-phosphate dehydrogenase [Hyphomicrobiales bacterium]